MFGGNLRERATRSHKPATAGRSKFGPGLSLALAALVAMVAVAPVATASRHHGHRSHGARRAQANESCATLDGRYEFRAGGSNGWTSNAPAPGITIQSAAGDKVVFAVADGFRLTALCVQTAKGLNDYGSDTTLPSTGPVTITITQPSSGPKFRQISFDTEVVVPPAPPVTCPSFPPAPQVAFDEPLFIDHQRAGGEPVSVVAQDGSISISAHAGTTHIYKNPTAAPGARDFAAGYTNQTLNWRSDDGGRSWQFIGLAGQREGPHSLTSTGFSDPDFAIDQAGNIYNTEIDLANVSVFKSPDDGQSYPIATPEAASGDRPWLTALEPDEVFLYVNSPKQMWRSTNGGVAWSMLPTPPVSSKSQPDPLNPDNGLIGPVGSIGKFAISSDDAQTWKTYSLGPLGRAQQFFGVLGVDQAGNVYQAAASGYQGSGDTNPNGEVTFAYYNRATGETNPEKITIPTPSGDALWPWIIAGDDGRAAVVWYQNLAGHPREFYIYAAVTNNAHGTTVTCSDGTTRSEPPKFTVVNASGRPVHLGDICLQGTNCNANPNFEGGDRRLGDFFTVNYDLDGNLFIAAADTTLKSPTGGPKPVGNPIFIKQISGDKMLAQPIPPHPTRCLFPFPSC